ncbi:MAG: S8 family serine peptidase [Bacteroidota bacterium]
MKKYEVNGGEQRLHLRKSKKLVGLRTTTEGKAEPVDAEIMPQLGGFELVTLKNKEDIDNALDEARASDQVEVGTHVYFADGDEQARPIVPTGILYIKFAEGVGEVEGQVVLDAYKLEKLDVAEDGTVIAGVTAQSRNPLKVAAEMEALGMVNEVTPDLDVPLDQYALTMPRDRLLGQQWHLDNNGFIPDVPNFRLKVGADAKIKDAWERLGNFGSRNITIAVIDNGFDTNHPDLREKIVSPLNISDGSNRLPSGQRFGEHATPVASVALASINGSGIVGAAPNARLMPLHGLTFSAWLTERMFNHCVRNRADVISCSWGTIQSQYRPNSQHRAAINRALQQGRGGKGCVVVFAAGNEGQNYINFYASLPGVIAVGSSTSSDTHPSYSNRGPELSVVAPSDGGWPILAARASWDPGTRGVQPHLRYYADGRDRGPHYKHFGGTSSATPLVAGICALILSANPDLTSSQVKSILERTADKIGNRSDYDSRGHSRRYGFGRVNADKAVAEAFRMRGASSSSGSTSTSVGGGSSSTISTPGGGNGSSSSGGGFSIDLPFGNDKNSPPSTSPSNPPSGPATNPSTNPSTPPGGGSVSSGAQSGKGLYRFSVGAASARGWGAQAGSFQDYANVLIQAEKAERLFGQPILVNIVEQAGGTQYRLIVGQKNSRAEVDAIMNKMRQFGYAPFAISLSSLA